MRVKSTSKLGKGSFLQVAVGLVLPLSLQATIHVVIDFNSGLAAFLRSVYFWESRGHTGSGWFDLILPTLAAAIAVHFLYRNLLMGTKNLHNHVLIELALIAIGITLASRIMPSAFDHEHFEISLAFLIKEPLYCLFVYIVLFVTASASLERDDSAT